MHLNKRHIEALAITLVYFSAFWFWSLPLQGNPMPFGDVDASSHFTIGDYMVSQDTSIAKIPYPLMFRYGGQNSAYPGYIWYPPQYWTNTGIGQFFGGDRIISFYVLVILFSSLIILTSYFLIRHLFGFLPAILSSLLLVFSTRDTMILLWGQWPQSLSFGLTPVALYCFHQYIGSLKERSQRAYLWAFSFTISTQFLFHPQGMIASIVPCGIFFVARSLKEKKLPSGWLNWGHFGVALATFFTVFFVFAPLNFGEFLYELTHPEAPIENQGIQLDKIFKWYHGIKNDPGLPDFYFTYNLSHGTLKGSLLSWWTLPLLIVGILFLLIRRKDEDLLLLSWLFSFYILTRLTVIGMGARDIRMFAYEAHVFYPIIALGAVFLGSLAGEKLKKITLPVTVTIFILLTIFVNGTSAYEVLKSQQHSIGRITPVQYEVAEWVRHNLPEKAGIYAVGTLGYQNFAAKIKWLMVLSQRHFLVDESTLNTTEYVFMDYSDAIALGNQGYVDALRQYESQFQNLTPLYNKNNIRVYKIGTQ